MTILSKRSFDVLILMKKLMDAHTMVITARIRRMGKVMFSVCSQGGGGQPGGGQVQPGGGVRSSRGGLGPARGGLGPARGGSARGGSGPARGVSGPAGGGQVRLGGGSFRLGGGQVQLGGGVSRDMSTAGVIATRRAVCLLRSRRRTFLFTKLFILIHKTMVICRTTSHEVAAGERSDQ